MDEPTVILECLCPHCLRPKAFMRERAVQSKIAHKLICGYCFKQFDVAIAPGKDEQENVVVLNN